MLLAASCGPQRYVVAPMPARPASLPESVPWPYLSSNGAPREDWCEYACGRFRTANEKVVGCRPALLSYPLQQGLDADWGVACDFR